MLTESDGSVHATNAIFEGPCLEEWEKWLPHGPVIHVGPLLAPSENLVVHEKRNQSPIEAEVDQFLDEALAKYGEHSVFFVSRDEQGYMRASLTQMILKLDVIRNCFLVVRARENLDGH